MVAFAYGLPAGIPGAANRVQNAVIEAQVIMPSNPPTFYGQAVMIDPVSGQVRPTVAGDGQTPAIYGFLVRPYPTQATNDPPWVNTPPAAGICNILKSGYIITQLFGGAAVVKGQQVRVGLAGVAGPNVNGGCTGSAVGATVAAVGQPNNTYFVGPADANGVIEIAFNV